MTFGLTAEMDIVAASGTLRVAIRSNPRARLIHVAVAVIVTVIFLGLRTHLGHESILFWIHSRRAMGQPRIVRDD